MSPEFAHFLRVVLVIGLVALPGNLARWVRYRALGDALAVAANLFLLAAAVWDKWGWGLVAPEATWQPLASIGLWSAASLLVLLTILQTQVIARTHYADRLKGRDRLQRALFAAGFVWFGVPPAEIDANRGPRVLDEEDAKRPMRFVYLVSGLVCLAVGLVQQVLVPDSWHLKRLTVHFWTAGILFFAGGLVDAFVLAQRRRLNPPEPPTHCEKCGYELRGLVEPRCPECGRPFARD